MTQTSRESFEAVRIGTIHSSLRSAVEAPRQADEGAPKARIDIDLEVRPALDTLAVGDSIVVLTWLHVADRRVLHTRPRNDPTCSVAGVFATRSPDRPNPIGLHPCVIVSIDGTGLEVDAIEAIDGTPVIDIKCSLLTC